MFPSSMPEALICRDEQLHKSSIAAYAVDAVRARVWWARWVLAFRLCISGEWTYIVQHALSIYFG